MKTHSWVLSHFSRIQLFATLWTVVCQAPLSMGISRQEYWSGLPCHPPRDLQDSGIKPTTLCLQHWQANSLPLAPPGKPLCKNIVHLGREAGGGIGMGNICNVNVWQKPLQYCKVISLQLIKINEKKYCALIKEIVLLTLEEPEICKAVFVYFSIFSLLPPSYFPQLSNFHPNGKKSNNDDDVCTQSCSTLCYPMNCSPPGSSVHGISQARILDWIAISYSRGSSRLRDLTQVSCISCISR